MMRCPQNNDVDLFLLLRLSTLFFRDTIDFGKTDCVVSGYMKGLLNKHLTTFAARGVLLLKTIFCLRRMKRPLAVPVCKRQNLLRKMRRPLKVNFVHLLGSPAFHRKGVGKCSCRALQVAWRSHSAREARGSWDLGILWGCHGTCASLFVHEERANLLLVFSLV